MKNISAIQNKRLYDETAIRGIPNFWCSFRAMRKYNNYIAWCCNHTHDGAENFPVWSRVLYVFVHTHLITWDWLWRKLGLD